MSAQKIEAELTTLTENFANLVRSARINEDTDDTKKSQVPGEILEVLAEKVVYAAQQLLRSTAELKRRAFLASGGQGLSPEKVFQDTAIPVKPSDFQAEVEQTLQELGTISVAATEGGMEDDSDLASLYNMTMELSGARHRDKD
ncbi:hypothetical protein COCSUDRAFT_54021 [Coccomyxa subellipsoidea C-169]|uniref:Uncharacterized protein n=1 Tax=Coccomyxa subellipsoidea (strain C-169) TaxID=574566 RepID=I0YT38_COCSC|nr:hypothetical protein COCSUDRAFT_54021 [Coccomyxa subellipsoidea C-169]EIE21557.1 hypothetical protein COCSUDRAFT_54021 [Coccomyxa subellipsoidea C-169]|eukprot:XP_005646101.1 hypothetical protein COCSUDRAFT_54021 [Coccomyxa subellipsoidea C-169]